MHKTNTPHHTAPTPSAKTSSADFQRQAGKGCMTVHLVEDSYDDRLFAEQRLKNSEQVTCVVSHSTAAELFHYLETSGAFDDNGEECKNAVILLDVHMPDMNGIETLKHIRTHPLTEDMPVILLTGDTSTELAFDAYQNHATAFLQKPLNLEHFHEVLKNRPYQRMTSR